MRALWALGKGAGGDPGGGGHGSPLYPDPLALGLREPIAARHKVSVGEVFVGNGSDEVLAHAFAALLKHDGPLLFPDISYSFYPTYAGLFGIEAVEVPLDAAFRIDIADYRRPAGAVILRTRTPHRHRPAA